MDVQNYFPRLFITASIRRIGKVMFSLCFSFHWEEVTHSLVPGPFCPSLWSQEYI